SALDDWLPQYRRIDARGRTTATGRLAACDRTYRPAEFSGLTALSVVTVDLAGGALAGDLDTTTVLADGDLVYASPRSLYVATTRWVDWGLVRESADRRLPDDLAVSTQIHQFDISDPARADYLASGVVEGTVLNQYSMSEHEGHLRVATTSSPFAWFDDGPSESFVTVLRLADAAGSATGPADLPVVGRVDGLGVGERIYAVRFLGDLAAVVTFRQTDPLYTLDLSDPTAPRVLGELKISGYSAYLHPLGDGLLLGVGQDATDEGRTLGTQVSVFDVADPADPVRLHRWSVPGGRSSVEFDPRAFLNWPPAELTVIPLIVGGGVGDGDGGGVGEGGVPFVGAFGLRAGRAGIESLGSLTHTVGDPPQHCEQWQTWTIDAAGVRTEGESNVSCWYELDWRAAVTRSVVVGDVLYTVSDAGLAATRIDGFETTSFLDWR
ncbi:MAG TPA: hypothetical protein DEP69_03400, partial [Acidimicrobiaceae bacterium]|nr:hypothetical protein [Acidimicrobiaceae bacterium]